MLLYLRNALTERPDDVEQTVREGALLRVRPKAMTVAVILTGLLPILPGHGAGSEVMSRIAAPMIGGMLTAHRCRCSYFRPPVCCSVSAGTVGDVTADGLARPSAA